MNTQDLDTLDFNVENNETEITTTRTNIIKVFGVGGGGCNAVYNMYKDEIKDVDFIICNTDKQVLDDINVPEIKKIILGKKLTQGLGAGNDPSKGEQAAREAHQEIEKALEGAQMVFITAGMGGGTGTGAAPVIANLARDKDILTVAIVTIPFKFEGRKRIDQAIEGLKKLQQNVDAMIVIDNNKLLLLPKTDVSEAFKKADDVLVTAARGIADIITSRGKINVDFADVKTVLKNSGVAILGTGVATGKDRAKKAIEDALYSPLLIFNDIKGAKNILLYIAAKNLDTEELDLISKTIEEKTGKELDTDIIWGYVLRDDLEDKVQVTIIATGFDANIIPNTDKILKKDNKQEKNNNNQNQNNLQLTDKNIKNYIAKKQIQSIDYKNTEKLKFYKEPALIRQNLKIQFLEE